MTTAQTTQATNEQTVAKAPSKVGQYLKTTGVFVLGAAAGAGAFYLVKKFTAKAAEVVVEAVIS